METLTFDLRSRKREISRQGGSALLRLSLLLFILMAALLCRDALAQGLESFSSSFTSGSPVGNIVINHQNCAMEPETGGLYHVLLDKPGTSVLKGSFNLSKMPKKMCIQINHRTSTILAISNNNTYSLIVNGQKVDSMELYYDQYVVMAYDITDKCQSGNNEFSIMLENTSQTSLWVRQIDISPVVSFVEQAKETKPQSIYLFVPLYLAYFCLIAITISYLLFVIMWKNRFDPQTATIMALIFCGFGYVVLPYLIFGFGCYQIIASFAGLIVGIGWILWFHR
ncbi:MAG: hypothetical protein AB9903_15195 [Vulcanimicrobiota bacterium]